MKNIWFILFIIGIGTAALIYFTRVPEIKPTLEEAQKNGTLIARYWLDQAIEDNSAGMKQASIGSASNQVDIILKEIHKVEQSRKLEFSEYSLLTMGGGGALKAMLSGAESVILMQMTLIMKEKEGKWYVSSVSID